MTDAELRDAAWSELVQTTVGWNKVANYPPAKLAATHWGKGKVFLDQIGVSPDPTVREAFPGQAVAVINSAVTGETVLLRGGTHPFFALPKSFAEPRLTITCEPGSQAQGIDTAGQDGYIFDGFRSVRPVNFSNINDSCFYIHDTSDRIRLIRSYLQGGCITLKVYCGNGAWATNLEIIDSEITGGGEDLSHWNGAKGFTIDHNYFHDPVFQSGTHQDAIQMTRARDFTVSRNHIRGQTVMGGNSQGSMIGDVVQYGESRAIVNAVFVNNLYEHWNENKCLLLTCCDNVKVVNNTMQDHSSTGEYASLTLDPVHGPISGVEVWNNILQTVVGGGNAAFFDTNWFTRTTYGANAYMGDAGFVDRVRYELTAGSQARGKGLTRAGTPSVDLDGNPRTSPVLGCRV